MSRKEMWAGYAFISPWLIGFLVFYLGTMIYSLVLSFYKADMLTPAQFIGLGNYAKVFNSDLFWKSLWNTAYYTLGSVPLRMIFGFALAMLMARESRRVEWLRTIYYLPLVVSGVVISLLWAWIYHPRYGILNYILHLVGLPRIPWLYSEAWVMPALILMAVWYAGENMIIYLAGIKGIPQYLYDAASIDGATPIRKFWHITLPMMSPTILFTFITGVIWSFQVFTQSYIMTEGGPNNASLTYVLYLYRTAFQKFQMGYASALAWVLFFIVLAVTLVIFKTSPLWVFYQSEVKGKNS